MSTHQSRQHVWYYTRPALLEETEEGPIEEKELVRLTQDGQIKLKTKLRSPTRRKNQWVYADGLPALKEIIESNKAAEERAKIEAREQRKRERLEKKPSPKKAEKGSGGVAA